GLAPGDALLDGVGFSCARLAAASSRSASVKVFEAPPVRARRSFSLAAASPRLWLRAADALATARRSATITNGARMSLPELLQPLLGRLRLGGVRRKGDHLRQVRPRLRRAAELQEGQAALEVAVEIGRVEGDRAREVHDRVLGLGLVQEQGGDVEGDVRVAYGG